MKKYYNVRTIKAMTQASAELKVLEQAFDETDNLCDKVFTGEELIKALKPDTEESFLLIGQNAVAFMNESGLEGLKKAFDNGDADIELFHWVTGVTSLGDLLCTLQGSMGYSFITKRRYNALAKFIGCDIVKEDEAEYHKAQAADWERIAEQRMTEIRRLRNIIHEGKGFSASFVKAVEDRHIGSQPLDLVHLIHAPYMIGVWKDHISVWSDHNECGSENELCSLQFPQDTPPDNSDEVGEPKSEYDVLVTDTYSPDSDLPRILIHMEGGVIQCISADRDMHILVIDEDAVDEGENPVRGINDPDYIMAKGGFHSLYTDCQAPVDMEIKETVKNLKF